ncbi:tRNA modification GTPase TrmE [Actinobacillus equuli]|nr:tRNA modification GTPase TrmE [Actinobacillus equuli]
MGYQSSTEGGFLARRRHLQALETAAEHLERGHIQLTQFLPANYSQKNCVWYKMR